MLRTAPCLIRHAKWLAYRTEDSIVFSSTAAKSYSELATKPHSKVHEALNNAPKEREAIPEVYDAEGAWNYVMKNPIDTPADAKPFVNPETGEVGGYSKLPEPTRYGDWEKAGICYDF
eukprot:NODE_3771_length_524_cov_29.296842_g3206_i0.p2 GENE.NODE_3771_length_524_cov_29.296842_g3206_i0~~NODE_3771_length_524_cov_29.296842_g3206_i0.p2  ORF type:complete len:137 (+),score=55.63 NODE_3771_length_524_cov_29.296842_g3206_i0:58-411(+)